MLLFPINQFTYNINLQNFLTSTSLIIKLCKAHRLFLTLFVTPFSFFLQSCLLLLYDNDRDVLAKQPVNFYQLVQRIQYLFHVLPNCFQECSIILRRLRKQLNELLLEAKLQKSLIPSYRLSRIFTISNFKSSRMIQKVSFVM